MRPLCAFLFCAGLLAGCYAGPSARPVTYEARAEKRAVVELQEVDGNIFKFSVENLTSETMVVHRDRVFLSTPNGTASRLSGGAAHTYTLPPGAAHAVNVKFDLSSFEPGTRVEVLFGEALDVHGEHVAIAPIPFVVE